MSMKVAGKIWPLFVLMICLTVSSLFAGQGDIKARMRERMPTIMALKEDGVIGENNKGFLQYMGDRRAKEALVAAENRDRRKVYSAIAEKQGTTPEFVGERRAAQIAQKAGPGIWIQAPDGKWYQK